MCPMQLEFQWNDYLKSGMENQYDETQKSSKS